jgi:hypothetical protein
MHLIVNIIRKKPNYTNNDFEIDIDWQELFLYLQLYAPTALPMGTL